MTSKLIVAIDGPSGVGKGTVASRVASALGYRHVDTGAMYRAVAWAAAEQGIGLDEENRLAVLAEGAVLDVSETRVAVNGRDVTRAIRTPAIDRGAAVVARLPRVRAVLVAKQQAMGAGGGIVMEGRDIGTVVFPSAPVKIYLDAAAEERARRRASDAAHAGGNALGLQEIASELAARDRLDTTRATSPLVAAPDAHVIDTTSLPIDAVVARVLELVRRADERQRQPGG
jgi:cytidylate kinase